MNILVLIISLCVLYSFALCYTTGLLSTAGKKLKILMDNIADLFLFLQLTLKCCCSLIKWKHHAIIFTWRWTFLSRFLLDTLWQRNFSPSVKLLLTALLNAAMKSALCKTNATVSSSITVHQDIPHIYIWRKLFSKGCFLLFCCLCYVFDSCNERGSMEGLPNLCYMQLLAGWLVLRLFYVILK